MIVMFRFTRAEVKESILLHCKDRRESIQPCHWVSSGDGDTLSSIGDLEVQTVLWGWGPSGDKQTDYETDGKFYSSIVISTRCEWLLVVVEI